MVYLGRLLFIMLYIYNVIVVTVICISGLGVSWFWLAYDQKSFYLEFWGLSTEPRISMNFVIRVYLKGI